MRWQNLTISSEEQAQLPGYRDEAVVRRFDVPEALDMRFYEVRAKSALNRVPAASRMPFRWTVNPYRGCSHACVYCIRGETPILMADGRTKPIVELRVGDGLYGTVREGVYRRFALTRVLAHWSSVKPAYRVCLEDGTELIVSGDHRFLTGRGWKHVIGADQGRSRRPHLTVGSKLMGPGRFADAPWHGDDYRRGYLCGLIRGDGHIGSYAYARPGRTHGNVHRFRLALTDIEALQRARTFLLDVGVATREFEFAAAHGAYQAVTAIRTSAEASVDTVREVIAWPGAATDEWSKGFLAGIFDAEGSCGPFGVLRIANTDPDILGWTERCLRRFRFDTVVERRPNPNGLTTLRVRGGLQENLRFFHTTDPAIRRKRSIEGRAVKTGARLGVVSIEPLEGAMRLCDITTGTGDFIADGVVSHNCFARPTHTYLGFDAGRDFEREIVVKVNVPEVLRAELSRPSWKREHVAMGTNTDPYQWVEGRYKLMPEIWAALRDSATPCSVLTKSPLVLRDLPGLLEVAERTSVGADLSIPTLDEKAWRATEPHTPHPRARLEAVAELNRAGIPSGVLIAPLMPGINDAPEQLEPLLNAASEAGAVRIGGIALHLRGEVRDVFFGWLRERHPELVPLYEELYARGAYAPRAERDRLAALVWDDPRATRGPRRGFVFDKPPAERADGPPLPPRAPEELTLF